MPRGIVLHEDPMELDLEEVDESSDDSSSSESGSSDSSSEASGSGRPDGAILPDSSLN